MESKLSLRTSGSVTVDNETFVFRHTSDSLPIQVHTRYTKRGTLVKAITDTRGGVDVSVIVTPGSRKKPRPRRQLGIGDLLLVGICTLVCFFWLFVTIQVVP